MSKKSASTLDMNEVFEAPEDEANRDVEIRNGNISSKGKLTGYFHGLKKRLTKEKKPSIGRTPSVKSNSSFYMNLSRKSRGSSVDEVGSSSSSPSPIPPAGGILKSSESGGSSGDNVTTPPLAGNAMETPGENGIGPVLQEDTNRAEAFPFYTLNVELISGKDLVVKDKSGSSDPYVKVKLGEKTLYKSQVVSSNLNPVWNEKFTVPIDDLTEFLTFKVADYDWGSKDDFMGMNIVDIRKLPLEKCHLSTLPLTRKGVLGTKSMGELIVSFTLVPRTAEEKKIWFSDTVSAQAQMKMQKHTWSGVLTVVLIDAHGLPIRSDESDSGYSNVFAKLRFGNEKRRSKQVMETTSRPEWFEQFDFYLFEGAGQAKVLEIFLFEESAVGRIPLGSCNIDTSGLETDVTLEKALKLANGGGEVSILITLSGIRPSGIDAPIDINRAKLRTQYSIPKTLKLESIHDVGHLTVKVHEAVGLAAADLGGKSDPYCVVQLLNNRVQTHTEYKTLTPKWYKTFQFPVRDITSQVELTVYDEDRDHKSDFLGKIIIPLWKIHSGQKKWYKLKNRKLAKGARGTNPQILLEMDLIWNQVRAAIRVTDPQEIPFNVTKPQLSIETFLINMERLRRIGMDLFDIWLYVKSCLDWEYPDRSLKALLIYQLFFFFFQPFFIPLLILWFWLGPWRKNYESTGIWVPSLGPPVETNGESGPGTAIDSDIAVDEDGEDEEVKKLALLEKFTLLQDASGVLQELLGELASICESTVNSYRMVVPFIYWLFALLFAAATLILVFVPFRYVAMIFGLHEFLRIYLRPWKKSTFELYHMIRRVPDQQKLAERLGINSVLRSIHQLKKKPSRGNAFSSSKRGSSTPTSPASATTWHAHDE